MRSLEFDPHLRPCVCESKKISEDKGNRNSYILSVVSLVTPILLVWWNKES